MFIKATQRLFFGYSYKFLNRTRLFSIVTNHDDIKEETGNTKTLKVAIIGCPNVGKSTFINNIMDRKVCPTSSKVHTTRKKSVAIFTEGDSQIVFIDTPGLVGFNEFKKYKLEKTFLKDCKNGLQEADIIGVLHDVSNPWTRDFLDLKIIRLLESQQKKPSFLIFNKVDLLKSKRKLLELTHALTDNCIDGKPIPGLTRKDKDDKIIGWPYFKQIFMISALTGSGLDDIKIYLADQAKPGPWQYPEDVYSNEKPENIITASLKATLLDCLPQEIPYQLNCELEHFETDEKGIIKTVVLVHCPSERIASYVAGASSGNLRIITEKVQQDLQSAFQTFVRIKIILECPNKK